MANAFTNSHLSGTLFAFLKQGPRYKCFTLKAEWPHNGIKRWALWEVRNVPELDGRFTRREVCQPLRPWTSQLQKSNDCCSIATESVTLLEQPKQTKPVCPWDPFPCTIWKSRHPSTAQTGPATERRTPVPESYTYALRLSASAKKVFSEDSAATSWSWKPSRRPYWLSLVFFKVRRAWSSLSTWYAGDLVVGRTRALPSVSLRCWDCSRRTVAAFLASKWAYNSYGKPYKSACRHTLIHSPSCPPSFR